MKDYFKALGYSLIVSIIAAIMARIAISPIVGLLHNKWLKTLSYDNAKVIYFWTGQIIGSFVFMLIMYITLRQKEWSKLKSIIAVLVSLLFLLILGIIVSSIKLL